MVRAGGPAQSLRPDSDRFGNVCLLCVKRGPLSAQLAAFLVDGGGEGDVVSVVIGEVSVSRREE